MVLYSFISDTGGSIVSKNVLLFRGCQECLECIEYLGLMIRKLFYLPQWGGGFSFIWPKRVCVVEQGVVFRVLSCKQGIKFHYI